MFVRQPVNIMGCITSNIIQESGEHTVNGWLSALPTINVQRSQERSCTSSALAALASKKSQQLMDFLTAGQVLREQVSGVDLAPDFSHFNSTGPDLLLYPQSVGLEMSQFTKAGPRSNAQGRARVRPHSDWQLQAKVKHERLMTQASARSFYQAIVLCFA